MLGYIILPKTVVKAEADTISPVFKSLSIDKKSGTVGDTINFTVDAMDDKSGIKSISITYRTPVTKKSAFIYLESSDGKYKGTKKISDTDESGIWKIDEVVLCDNSNNFTQVWNSAANNYGQNKPNNYSTDLSMGNFEVKGTQPDTVAPVFKSFSIDKQSGIVGDIINFTVEAIDDKSGIKSITITYKSPVTKKTEFIYLASSGGKYIGIRKIKETDEFGIWKIENVILYDNAGNMIQVWNSAANDFGQNRADLSAGDFQVKDSHGDTTSPIFKSLSIDKQSATIGDTINFTVEAMDDMSGIESIYITYRSPVTKTAERVFLTSSGEKYTGKRKISEDDESGIWKIEEVVLCDNASNITQVWNSYAYNYGQNRPDNYSADLSMGDFEVKELNNTAKPLSEKYITENEYWTSNAINGDLYVGPQAVLTINGPVTVNGNIYVLGAMKNYGDLTVTGTIYASQFIWANSTVYNGTVLMLGGVNSIGSIVTSNDPMHIPFKLYETKDNNLIAFDGKIKVTGATLPIIDLYMDGVKMNYHYNGTFSLDLDTKNKQKIEFKTVDVFGNEKIYTYNILNKYYDTNADNTVNIMDLANVAKGYNTKKSDVSWQEQYDYNCDGVMDIYDLVTLSKRISLTE